jgi:hypothetical protein
MTSHTTTPLLPQSEIETEGYLFDNWFDPIEAGLRDRTRDFLQAMFEGELDEVLARSRYSRRVKPLSGDSEAAPAVTGHRHGHRSRSLLGTFGKVEITVPRARLDTPDGKTTEWKSRPLRAYQRRTLAADALIASCYLAGTNTRRVRRALAALFAGAVGKDTVSRVWRKVKSDWDAWNARSLTDEPIVRLILDGTVVRVRRINCRGRSANLQNSSPESVIAIRGRGVVDAERYESARVVPLCRKDSVGQLLNDVSVVVESRVGADRAGAGQPSRSATCIPTEDGGVHDIIVPRSAVAPKFKVGGARAIGGPLSGNICSF